MSSANSSNSWWSGTAGQFCQVPSDLILGQLAAQGAFRNLPPTPEQMESWLVTFNLLRGTFEFLICVQQENEGLGVLLEFEIPRRAKRIDVVLISKARVLVVEMKVGATAFDRAAQIQAIDYALDLVDFHSASRHRKVTPVLVVTGVSEDGTPADPLRGSLAVQNLSPSSFQKFVAEFFDGDEMPGVLGVVEWEQSEYSPTPNILEAAREVFAGHDVSAISMAKADNLTHTATTITAAIKTALDSGSNIVCFVTGIPGSGKTLTGLSAAHTTHGLPQEIGFSYLSGNGPLVEVLRYAIALDRTGRDADLTLKEAERESSVLIQHIRDFLDHHLGTSTPPHENVIVFDEAQRAWDAHQMKLKSRSSTEKSQAEITFEIMGRREDWSVIVALVGNGQEINRGEAGIAEWFNALEKFPEWALWTSPEMEHLVPVSLSDRTAVHEHLHLDVVTRAPRGEKLATWVDALLANDLEGARSAAAEIENFPILLTRNLDEARRFLLDCAAEDKRVGIVATSQDRRLRAFGLERSTSFIRSINWPKWFVNGMDDTRSSYALEVAASEFECQGLEIDWAMVCWGGDLIATDDGWIGRRFKGDKWQKDKDLTMATNRYRVLLTRARKGMIIWVPDTMGREILRVDNSIFDRIAMRLTEAGVRNLLQETQN